LYSGINPLLRDREHHENGCFSQVADEKPPEKLNNFFGGLLFGNFMDKIIYFFGKGEV
jgi:hypothetical protein